MKSSTTHPHHHPRTNILIQYTFTFFLILFLCLVLIFYIRNQKYQRYLDTLNSRPTTLHPQIRLKSKQIMAAFDGSDFDSLRLLVDPKEKDDDEDDDDEQRALLRRALYDYSLSARPHLTDHIISRECLQSLQILLETNSIDPNSLHLVHTVISDLKGHARHREFMETLLNHGADPDLPDRKGHPPIAHAIIHNNLEALDILLAHRAQINVPLHSHDSFLHLALSFLHPSLEIIRALLLGGANPFHRGSDGQTAFHHALRKHPRKLSLIRLFLNTPPPSFPPESYIQALLNYPSAPRSVIRPTEHTRYGYSPLHWAVASCKPGLVQFLLNRGANPAQPDSDNITPLQLAHSLKNQEMIFLFTHLE